MDRLVNLEVFRALQDARREAHILVDALERKLIEELCEVALNVIIGNIPTEPDQLQRLRRFKKELLAITDPSASPAKVLRNLKEKAVVTNILDAALPRL